MNDIGTLRELPNTDSHNCFACSPINPSGLKMKFYTDEDKVISWLTVPQHLCGWNTLVHGGVLSTILDEVMSWTAMYHLKHFAMTRDMAIAFIKPVFVGQKLRAEGRVLEVERHRNALVEGCIYNDAGQACARATGHFALFSTAVAKRMGVMDDASLTWFETVIRSADP